MRLSEAIRMNGMMKPQGFGASSIRSIDAPCALGGALQSIGRQYDFMLNCYDTVRRVWPYSTGRAACPQCALTGHNTVLEAIYHLNDDHHWTRQQIADWVASVEPQEECEDGGQGPVANVLEVTAI